MWSSDEMIQELKNRGKRITKQRKIMVEVIASKKAGVLRKFIMRFPRKTRQSVRLPYTVCC